MAIEQQLPARFLVRQREQVLTLPGLAARHDREDRDDDREGCQDREAAECDPAPQSFLPAAR
jgi:hypothetical protein